MGHYLAGPLFLVKPGGEVRSGELTVSHCLAAVAPDTWAIEWVTMGDTDRAAAAAASGISQDHLPDVIAWATERFDRGFAWPHAFVDLATAQEFRRRFLPDGFHLLQIALPEHLASSFLELAAPPAQQPGYAPMGASGAYQALLTHDIRLGLAERRGMEVLGYDRCGGGFHSFRCNGFEPDFAELGASFNRWGLIEDEAAALECADLANKRSTCADGWHPWLVVEHP